MPPRAQNKQTGSILHIRTFADDLQRAHVSPAPSTATNTDGALRTPAQNPVPIIPLNKTPDKKREERLQAELSRHAEPLAPTARDARAEHRGHAFDIKEAASEAVGDATIIEDRAAKRPSALDEMMQQARNWWNTTVVPLYEEEGDTAEIHMDIAPSVQSPAWQFDMPARAVPHVRTLAHDAEDVQGGRRPALPPVPSTSWKRISEPRRDAAIPHTSADELSAYRDTLRAIPRNPARDTPRRPFKEARQVRSASPTAELISKEADYAVASAPEAEARARLSRLAPQTETAPEPRISRDTPYIPPQLSPVTSATPIRTYRYDALSDIKRRGLSKTHIASEEMERRQHGGISPTAPSAPASSRIVPLLGGLIFVLLCAFGGTFAYQRLSARPPVVQTAGTVSYFATDAEVALPLQNDRSALLESLNAARLALAHAQNESAHFAIRVGEGDAATSAATEELLRILDLRIPGAFIRTLGGPIMFGAYGSPPVPFIVLKTTHFETAFAGMLAWEEYISADLTPLFGGTVRRSYDPAALTNDHTRAAYFSDVVIQNKDVRVLYDEYGAERILYSFVDAETVVITTSSESLQYVIQKLR